MREEFEKLPEIAKMIESGDVWWSEKYNSYSGSDNELDCYVDGAWYAYQEQQKKIDLAKKEIGDFFDNQTIAPSPREYANKLADLLEILK